MLELDDARVGARVRARIRIHEPHPKATVAAAITGEGSVMCAASSGLDLGLALVFGYGLLMRARSGTVAPIS